MNKASLCAVLLTACVASVAQAHSHLRTSTPAEGSTVTAPEQVALGFSESSHLAALTLTPGVRYPP